MERILYLLIQMSKTDSSTVQDVKPPSLLNGSSSLADGMTNSKTGA